LTLSIVSNGIQQQKNRVVVVVPVVWFLQQNTLTETAFFFQNAKTKQGQGNRRKTIDDNISNKKEEG
jgi:hypothetical protein